ncbi:hypothetical protein D3C77_416060 [compost metagenome]
MLTGQADPLFDRPLGDGRDNQVSLHPGVHGTDDVGNRGITAAPFVLHWARWVALLQPVVECIVVGTIAGLVAKRPDDDAGMVAIDLHHPGDARAVGG